MVYDIICLLYLLWSPTPAIGDLLTQIFNVHHVNHFRGLFLNFQVNWGFLRWWFRFECLHTHVNYKWDSSHKWHKGCPFCDWKLNSHFNYFIGLKKNYLNQEHNWPELIVFPGKSDKHFPWNVIILKCSTYTSFFAFIIAKMIGYEYTDSIAHNIETNEFKKKHF